MKLLVEIEIQNTGAFMDQELLAAMKSNVPEGFISIDEIELQQDPNDSNFYIFKFIGVLQ